MAIKYTYYDTLPVISEEKQELIKLILEQNEVCEILYLDEKRNEVSIESKVTGIVSSHNIKYLKLKKNLEIPLHKIIMLNGVLIKGL